MQLVLRLLQLLLLRQVLCLQLQRRRARRQLQRRRLPLQRLRQRHRRLLQRQRCHVAALACVALLGSRAIQAAVLGMHAESFRTMLRGLLLLLLLLPLLLPG